ncbi:serine/threonine protein kinase [Psychromonas algicola]|uniref:serine/threonine protein kinase n=1 Tax=Psychromonas algicola TaxID=2555642 RepID=UPI001068020C|nr:serine/threonine protein kinase [Psychromonas sp. RZ5]TEW52150.1 serine/threonine protein kinase [Psychromonas sp. RZ5]
MVNANLTYQSLTPECQLDALASIGIYPETGLLALNSYENRVYSFVDEQQMRYVVKFYRPERWNEQQLLEDHQFSERLLSAGLNLSAPIAFEGKTLHSFAGYYFALFNNLSARSLAVDNIDSLYDVGIALGQLHKVGEKHQFKYRPALDVIETIQQAANGLMNCVYIPTTIKTPLLETIANIENKISHLNKQTLPMIAIHGDAHASNILLKDEQPYWVDFDDCKMGPAVQDIWMLLNGDKTDQQLQLSMILEGYQEEHDFDTRQLSEIESLRTMRIINYVNWINSRWSDPAFSRNFPWFTTDQYWKELLQSLQQQLMLLDEAPLTLQPQY